MINNTIFLKDLFAKNKFHSSHITKKELKELLVDAVKQERPKRNVKRMKFIKGGVEILLDDGEMIFVEVDQQEIIIS